MDIESERGAKTGVEQLRTAQASKDAANRAARARLIDESGMQRSAHERAAFYRKRAAEIRLLLTQMKDPQARALIEQTIANYEHLAILVDERATSRTH